MWSEISHAKGSKFNDLRVTCDLPKISEGGFVRKSALEVIARVVGAPWYGDESARSMILQAMDTFTTLSVSWEKLTFADCAVWSRPEAGIMIFIAKFVLNPLFEDAMEHAGMASCFGMSFAFVTPSC